MKHLRKCIGCGALKEQKDLIKITYVKSDKEAVINTDTKKFGRSAYLCYNNSCIEEILKKNKLQKCLKSSNIEDIRLQLEKFSQGIDL